MDKHTPKIQSSYLHPAFNQIAVAKMIKVMVRFLENYDFDALAFRGMSGALITPMLSVACKKSLIMVRKPKCEEMDHTDYRVEGDINTKKYIIVDDFISSGNTCRTIVHEIYAIAPEAICIGVLLYSATLKYGAGRNRYKPRITPMHRLISSDNKVIRAIIAPDPEVYRIKVEKK